MTRPESPADELMPYLTLPLRISPTRAELTDRCQRRHWLADRLHLRRGRSAAAAFGTQLHRGTDAFWRSVTDEAGFELPGQRIVAFNAAVAAATKPWEVDPDDERHTPELARTLLEEYTKNGQLGAGLPGTWRIVENETRHSFTRGDVEVTYQTDRLIENEKGELAIVDTKTASKLSSRWEDGMRRSLQQRAYRGLEQARLGRPISYVIVEGLQKTGQIGEVRYLWADMGWTENYVQEAVVAVVASAQRDARGLAELESDEPAERWEHALEVALTRPDLVGFNYMDCQSYYFQCPYYELCHTCPTERLGLALSEYDVVEQPY